jgi:hypothetical protein
MQEILDIITKIITDYNASNNHNPDGLVDMGRNLSSNLFFLEKHRAEKQKAFEACIYSLRQQGERVNAATNEANVKHPELYMLRRFMEAAEKVHIQISVELSWIKAEMMSTARDNA